MHGERERDRTTWVRLRGSRRRALDGAHRAGDANPNTTLEVTLVVRRRRALKGSSPPPLGPASTREERIALRERFAKTHGARQKDLDAVARYARSAGLRVTASSRARRTITLSGPLRRMNAAFDVDLGEYRTASERYRGREGSIRLPRRLDGVVQAVLGLDARVQGRRHPKTGGTVLQRDLPRATADARTLLAGLDSGAIRARARGATQAAASQNAGGVPAMPGIRLWPAQVGRLHNFPTGVDCSGQTVAIIALGGGYQPDDVATFFKHARIAPPAITTATIGRAAHRPGRDPVADAELMLDIGVVGSIAPGAAITVYFAGSDDQGFFNAVSSAIHDPVSAPSVVSISWGQPEIAWTGQARAALVSAFADAAALGVTVLCAAGDHGADDAVGDCGRHVEFPASSPNVVACGGTTPFLTAAHTVDACVWNERDGWATGGGVSRHYRPPPWQRGLGVPRRQSGRRARGRGVPDIAGDADRLAGYVVRSGGVWLRGAGTSAVAPLYAGLCALINAATGSALGALAPRLYALHAQHGGRGLHDVTLGDNDVPPTAGCGAGVTGHRAAKGWDACTGLGIVDGSELLALIREE